MNGTCDSCDHDPSTVRDPVTCWGVNPPLCMDELHELCKVLKELEWRRYCEAGLRNNTSAAASGSAAAAVEWFTGVDVSIKLWLNYSDANHSRWRDVCERWVIHRNDLTNSRMTLGQKVAACAYKGVSDIREGRGNLTPPAALVEHPLLAGPQWWESDIDQSMGEHVVSAQASVLSAEPKLPDAMEQRREL